MPDCNSGASAAQAVNLSDDDDDVVIIEEGMQPQAPHTHTASAKQPGELLCNLVLQSACMCIISSACTVLSCGNSRLSDVCMLKQACTWSRIADMTYEPFGLAAYVPLITALVAGCFCSRPSPVILLAVTFLPPDCIQASKAGPDLSPSSQQLHPEPQQLLKQLLKQLPPGLPYTAPPRVPNPLRCLPPWRPHQRCTAMVPHGFSPL